MNPWNKKLLNLTLISRKNQRLNRGDSFENLKNEINLNYDSKLKLKARRR